MPPQDAEPGRVERWPVLAESPILRLVTLCGLYVAQGLPWGFVSVAIAATLAARGMDAAAIAELTVMATLPWSFKWVWGPIIDRFRLPAMGRRRPWILLAQSGMITMLVLLSIFPGLSADFDSLKYAVFFVNCFSSLQDVSVDALAVDLLKPHERGRANGLMYGSSYGGNALGGAVLGLIAATVSLQFAFFVLAMAVACIMLLPLLLRERRGDRFFGLGGSTSTSKVKVADFCGNCGYSRMGLSADRPCPECGEEFKAPPEGPKSFLKLLQLFVRAFSLVPTFSGVILALLASITTGLLGAFMSPLMIQDLGWTQVEYSSVMGTIIFVGLGGSIVGGFLADAIGARRMAAIAGLGMALMWVIFAMTPHLWTVRTSLITYLVIDTALGGMFSVSLFALFMGVSWKKMAATQFTTYMAMLNLSRIIGASLAQEVDGKLDYSQIFLLSALITVAAIMVLPLVSPARAQHRFKLLDRVDD